MAVCYSMLMPVYSVQCCRNAILTKPRVQIKDVKLLLEFKRLVIHPIKSVYKCVQKYHKHVILLNQLMNANTLKLKTQLNVVI